jgi:galactosylceramidase
MARIINQNWIGGQMTATIAWNLISSYYPWLAWSNDGLMTARTPWSGHYSIDPPIYSAAHTSQFAAVGSWLLSVGEGSGFLTDGGSYVSYVSEDAKDFSLVVEKVSPHKAGCGFSSQGSYNVSDEKAEFTLTAGSALHLTAAGKALAGYRSNFIAGTFMQPIAGGVMVAADGSFSVEVAVDDLITLTNTRPADGPAPPALPPPPADSPMPTHFSDDFEQYTVGSEASLWAQASGSFEVAALPGGKKVLKQAAVGFPVKWLRDDVLPVTQLGDRQAWGDTNLSITVGLPGAADGVDAGNTTGNAVFVGVHVQIGATDGSGVWVAIEVSGDWWLTAGKASALHFGPGSSCLAHGTLDPTPKPGADGVAWTRVELSAVGTLASLSLNGRSVASGATIPKAGGNVAIGSLAYAPAFYDDFTVAATGNAPPPPPPSPHPGPGPPPLPTPSKCAAPAAGQPVGLWGCDASNKAGQFWKHGSKGQLELISSDGKLCIAPMSVHTQSTVACEHKNVSDRLPVT